MIISKLPSKEETRFTAVVVVSFNVTQVIPECQTTNYVALNVNVTFCITGPKYHNGISE